MDTQDDIKLEENNWSNEEDQRLTDQYTIDKLEFLELCEIYKRNPDSISSRLKYLNLIDTQKNIRGYREYLRAKKNKPENTIVSNECSVPSDSNTHIKVTSRMGTPWKEEEIIQLVQENKSISEISETHQRTNGSIKSKLRQIAANYYILDKKTIKEIEKCTRLTEEVILNAVQKQYKDSLLKQKNKPENTIVSNEWSIVTSDNNTNIKIDSDQSQFPPQMGKAWKEEEIIQENKSILEISEILQRTEGGVTSKLKGLAADFYISNKKTIKEIEKCTGLSEEVIQRKQYKDSLPKKEKNTIIPSNLQETSLNELLVVVKDIQNKINIILEKIK